MAIKHNDSGFRNALVSSTLLGVMFSAVLFNVLHAHAQRGFDIDVEFDVGCSEEGAGSGEVVAGEVPTGLPPGQGAGTTLPPADGSTPESAGSGDTPNCPKQCKVMFDTYLLSADVWENRISQFAQAMFQQVVGNLTTYGFCLAGSKFNLILGLFGSAEDTEIAKKPDCTLGLSSGDISGMAKDTAKRTLLYDNIVRCQARDMINTVTSGLTQIAATSGRDGGSTYVRDYVKLQTDAENRGRKRAINNMANTRYCPWIQLQMEALYGFSKDEAIALSDNADNGAEPYTQRAECSFPPGTTSEDIAQMPEGMYLLSLPQNNLLGAYLMAQEEVERQITLQVEADKTDAVANSGNLGSSGTSEEESCVQKDPKTGICLQYAPKIQTGDGITASVENAQEAELNWIITSNKMGQLMGNSANRILNRAIDFTRRDISFDFTPDQAQELYNSGGPDVDQSPDDPPAATGYQTCAGGGCGCPADEPVCQCVIDPNSPGYDAGRQMAQLLRPAMGRARLQNSFLFQGGDPDGLLLPDKVDDYVTAVCFEMGASLRGCRPYTPRADDVILFPLGGLSYAIDIVTAAGKPRGNPTAKYLCEDGAY